MFSYNKLLVTNLENTYFNIVIFAQFLTAGNFFLCDSVRKSFAMHLYYTDKTTRSVRLRICWLSQLSPFRRDVLDMALNCISWRGWVSSVEYLFIAITPRSNLTRSNNTCWGPGESTSSSSYVRSWTNTFVKIWTPYPPAMG